MKFIRLGIAVLALVMASANLSVFATEEADSPAAVTQALYRQSLDHSTGFDAESIKLVKPWIAPTLYARLWKKLNEPQPKDGAPDIEGDVFLDSQEFPAKFEVSNTSINQTRAKVGLTLIWKKEKRHYTVLLERINDAWKVYDVNYGKDGRLTDMF